MNNQTNTQPVTQVTPVQETALSKIRGKYTVTPCKKTWLHALNPQHDGATIFSNSQIWIVAERNAYNRDVVITGLNEQEQAEFEKIMNVPAGTLSPYNKAWWARVEQAIKVPKEGLQLDCDNNVKHKLQYKLLMVNSKVAKSKEDLVFNGLAEVVITSAEVEAKTDSQNYLTKGKAYAKFNAMSLDEKVNFLKVYGEGIYKVTKSASPDFVDQAIGKIIEASPEDFLNSFSVSFYKEFILLEDLLTANIIVKKGGRFFINGGGSELGATKAQVVANLSSDEYQDTKIGLIAKLEAQK